MKPAIGQFEDLDSISVNQLINQIGIHAINTEWDKTGSYSGFVKSFSCLALRENEIIGFEVNRSAKFNDTIKSLFDKLKPGDEVHFINIVADSPFRKNEQLDPIKLTLR